MIIALLVTALLLCGCGLSTHRRLGKALLAAGLLMAFTGLAVGVQYGADGAGWVTGLDAGVASWFGTHRSYGWDVVAGVIADIGSPVATATIGLGGGLLLSLRARSVIPGFVVVSTVGGAAFAETIVKAIVVTRPVPAMLAARRLGEIEHPRWEPLKLLPTEPNSFPSGHVAGTAALVGILAVFIGAGRSRAVRTWLASLVCVTVLVVAVSRLYLGVHWLTDVIGGMILAALFVTLGVYACGVVQFPIRPCGPGAGAAFKACPANGGPCCRPGPNYSSSVTSQRPSPMAQSLDQSEADPADDRIGRSADPRSLG
ncbi:phosphatase PAP2 family protein [Mycolicibacterium hodleri]|uniref:Phosphatase PAP2 family protein n=1 Tax=Mycolicibacterium hodleri TaxID=49897 RepID=A0A502EBS1_9MYCO|nr:phosphatase PAP2 family protein [Mycolicibacterium hodleri]TPG35108.1 phosphatase PAP2 family protein [Mycolicibacterium hodleri]